MSQYAEQNRSIARELQLINQSELAQKKLTLAEIELSICNEVFSLCTLSLPVEEKVSLS